MWMLPVVVSFLLIQSVSCGGTVEVRLITYNYLDNANQTQRCCDVKDTGCDACDPYIEIFLANQTNFTLPISNTEVTNTYNNTNHIDFGTFVRSHNISFNQFNPSFYLVFRVYDKNVSIPKGLPTSRLIDLVPFRVGQGEPSSFLNHPNFTLKTQHGSYAEISFEYIIKCRRFFYGDCHVYCKPVPGQYNCSKYGRRVCLPGWSGVNCTVYNLSCKNTTCQNGGTCSTTANATTCQCTPDYTGTFCQLKRSTTVTNTQIVSKSTDSSHGSTRSTTRYRTNQSSTTNKGITKPTFTRSYSNTGTRMQTNTFFSAIAHINTGRTTFSSVTHHKPSSPLGFTVPTLASLTLSLNQSTFKMNTVNPDSPTNLTGAIVGGLLGIILLLAIVLSIIVIMKKKGKKGRKVQDSKLPMETNYTN